MSGFQILLLLLITMWTAYDVGGPQMLFSYYPAMLGLILGAVFGDVKTGLLIGGTLQLMSMGIAGIGASSVPDYAAATIVAVPIAITTGGGLEAGLLVGIPVAMLGVQFEIMLRICNGFISRWSQSACEKGDFKKMINVLYLSPILGTMITTIPVMMFTLLGIGVVNSVLEFLPDWFMGGLGLAGRLLPAVGLSILLSFMPIKKYISYAIIGFVMFAYLHVPVLGCALVGLAVAILYYLNKVEAASSKVGGGLEDE